MLDSRATATRADGRMRIRGRFKTAILGLKMFAKVSCDEKESIEEQKFKTRSTIVPCAGSEQVDVRVVRYVCRWEEDLVCIQELNS